MTAIPIVFRSKQYNLASDSDCGKILEQLASLFQIEDTEARQFFQGFDRLKLNSVEQCELLYQICDKCSFVAPMEAFQYSMKLLEVQPGMFSGEKSAHPGYVYRESAQRTFTRCPICGREGRPFFRSISYRLENFQYPHLPFKLWMQCEGCSNLYTWKYPEELLALSRLQKRINPNPDAYWATVQETNAATLAIWCDILSRLQGYAGGTSLLEVGIGKGELLAVALETGFDADAVEIMPESAQKVSDMLGISIWAGDFLNYAPEKRYSIITMGDVIEHVTDPTAALKNAYRLLEDDGVLWLSTPNYESSFSRMMKFQYPMWLEPYHITYFSFRGFARLAESCGFEILEYNVSKRYNGSMELIMTKAKK